jgi:UPF0755 protein
MLKKIVLISVAAFLVVTFIMRKDIMSWLNAPKTINTSETKFLLKENPSFNTLIIKLKANGIIDDVDALRQYAIENKLDTTKYAGGKYQIFAGTKYGDLLHGFELNKEGNGNKELMVKVIFNTCRDLNDVSGNVAQCIAADSASLINYIQDPKVLSKYGFTIEQMPALFLPKQYELPYDTDAEQFVEFMAAKFKAFWTDERKAKLKKLGFNSQSKAATLASIVYSEQSTARDEWPIIAKLYLNRIDKGIRLQSDPTFKFCWGHELDEVQILLHKHRDIDCDYNTYKIYGLPPGPICIVPASVIDAVLNPASVDYIYMCAKPDYTRTHNFTASGDQHNKNAKAFQKWIREQQN